MLWLVPFAIAVLAITIAAGREQFTLAREQTRLRIDFRASISLLMSVLWILSSVAVTSYGIYHRAWSPPGWLSALSISLWAAPLLVMFPLFWWSFEHVFVGRALWVRAGSAAMATGICILLFFVAGTVVLLANGIP